MEIALVNKGALRIKGKTATFIVNPEETTPANANLVLDENRFMDGTEETVVLQGPGEYEVGGIKITAVRGEKGIIFSMNIEELDLVVGKIATLSALQHKLKEYNVVISLCDEQADAAFLTSLATNVVMFYGEKATETAQGFEKDNLKQMNKYSVALSKLPTEVETILLA